MGKITHTINSLRKTKCLGKFYLEKEHKICCIIEGFNLVFSHTGTLSSMFMSRWHIFMSKKKTGRDIVQSTKKKEI